MIHELFTACIDASRVLGVDDDFRAHLEAARAKLPPYRIGRNSQLQEWEQDDGGQTNHRHTSHLVGLFPLAQITPTTTPDLARAAARSLDLRMGRKDWEDVEWSRANAINYHARLRDGQKAKASVMELIRKLTGNNLLDHFGRRNRRGRERHLLDRWQLRGRRASPRCWCRAIEPPRTDSS